MKILDFETDFDFNDADDMERLENAIEVTEKKLNDLNIEGKRTSQIIREGCQAIFNCFNIIFGEDSDKKIFGEKTNFNLCIKAFKDLVEAKEQQEKEFEAEVQSIEKKYNPNRATRRAKNNEYSNR